MNNVLNIQSKASCFVLDRKKVEFKKPGVWPGHRFLIIDAALFGDFVVFGFCYPLLTPEIWPDQVILTSMVETGRLYPSTVVEYVPSVKPANEHPEYPGPDVVKSSSQSIGELLPEIQ